MVAAGTADATLVDRWRQHLTRLLHETLTWEAANAQIADRSFAGHAPLFAAEAAQLAQVRNRCEALVRTVAAAKRPSASARKVRARIDPAAIRPQAAAAAPPLVDQLRAAARFEVELVFGARPGLLYVQQRIAATKATLEETS
jgi:hypothetical protein